MQRLTPDQLFSTQSRVDGLARRASAGAVAVMASQTVQFVLRTGSIVILARLLNPADYGILGMVSVVTNFALLFKDLGLQAATIQQTEITERQVSALFWLSMGISLVLTGVVLLSAPLVGIFYKTPATAYVTAAMAASFVLSGLTMQHIALLRRHLMFGAIAVTECIAQAAGIGATIACAWFGGRHWALVAGILVRIAVAQGLVFWFCPWRPRLVLRAPGVRDMLAFGGHFTAFNVVNYLSRNVDRLLIGKSLGGAAVGLYGRAFQLFMLPITQIRFPVTKIAMPALSALRPEPARYARQYLRLVEALGAVTVPITVYCIIEAEFIVTVLLGPTWAAAAPIFRILAIGGLVRPIADTLNLVLLSSGLGKRLMRWGAASAVVTVTAFAVGLPYGLTGVAWGGTAAACGLFVPGILYCLRATPIAPSRFLAAIWFPALSGLLAGTGLLGILRLLPTARLSSHLAAGVVFGAVTLGLAALRPSLRMTVAVFLSSLRVGRPS